MSLEARRTRPATQRGFTLVEILVVITIIAALIGMVAAVIPRAVVANRKVQCQSNLRNIGGVLMERLVNGKMGSRGGPAMLLQAYTLALIREGDERVFLCPNDPAWEESGKPGFSGRYRRIDLDHPDPALCSYRVRDTKRFPLRSDSTRKEPLAACPHHEDGVTVLYDDGSVQFLDRAALGLGPKDPVVVGPGSPAEVLRVFPGK